ncbi:MAG: rRNA pseudouridine synthase [Clostridiales bacterium]|nr:rRNA pseudouridine synthase [Clostridiales bacterium]
MRLNKFLSSCGVASRRKCEEIILEGRVQINNKVVLTLATDVNEKKDVVSLDGKVLSLPNDFVYLKLNKPKGYACTSSDERGRKTIFDLVESDVRLFNVGRLDYDTEGLIFLTNDGDFANMVTHPRFNIEKEYIATVEGEMKESELAVLRKGVVENGVRMPQAKVKLLGYDGKFSKVSVVIDEGQNRQVRRMFDCIGKSIKLLKRVRIGKVVLGGLYRGKTKPMTQEEIDFFKDIK